MVDSQTKPKRLSKNRVYKVDKILRDLTAREGFT